jgi:hypothetical protein
MQVERDIVIDILRSSYLFSDLSDEQVEAIADQATLFCLRRVRQFLNKTVWRIVFISFTAAGSVNSG